MTEDWPELGQSLNDFGGDWDNYLNSCYAIYMRDFHYSKPKWPIKEQRFAEKRHPIQDGKSGTFWHVTSEGRDESQRIPSLSRLERIAWPRVVLDEFSLCYPSSSSEKIRWWVEKRKNENRYVISISDYSYVVIVADRGSYVLLWTAFPVEHSHAREKRKRAFERYWERKG